MSPGGDVEGSRPRNDAPKPTPEITKCRNRPRPHNRGDTSAAFDSTGRRIAFSRPDRRVVLNRVRYSDNESGSEAYISSDLGTTKCDRRPALGQRGKHAGAARLGGEVVSPPHQRALLMYRVSNTSTMPTYFIYLLANRPGFARVARVGWMGAVMW
ncbi:hypothetical protein EVAR_16351_1 [Eumeta japonica]|uniref:Uncharacterized protein n=1 Tax=Eumeta variegata TaxID=151549 RepID=A0A4C1VF32_EUMVA|nr:hypothetical protein EVAR_16351_1 [Eumeta japonica]